MSKVFISYKRSDAERVRIIREKLQRLKVPFFMDIQLTAGDHWLAVLNEQLKDASAVLVLWTKASVRLPKDGVATSLSAKPPTATVAASW
jgi:hypothetical protein